MAENNESDIERQIGEMLDRQGLITIRQAATLTGYSEAYIRQIILHYPDRVRTVRVGNFRMINRDDILAYKATAKPGVPARTPKIEEPEAIRGKFDARKGGHAPILLRRAFEDWCYKRWLAGRDASQAEIAGEERPARWLLGRLWNCTDTMPGGLCQALKMPKGSTYAQGARKARRALGKG